MAVKNNRYELTIITDLNPKTKKGETSLEKTKKTIADMGTITEEKNWGKKDLAYPIQKQTSAYYYWFAFEADPAKVARLDNVLKLNDNILRHLLIVLD
ncbi:MAG: 30S ribosomal protein S6 [Candidatus Shapirobacteria bacterium]|nr:30S ribosomal protein S6 [Candidatus Shapirobacteria bacterium]MDD5073765.1 30S ribosomal protein S6 [Candidatus Shapirobacteria bacterium]MDD5481634.1 30S ribosomal protein S6 [Candidatus Shapirobacteria bacterium]